MDEDEECKAQKLVIELLLDELEDRQAATLCPGDAQSLILWHSTIIPNIVPYTSG